MFGMSRSLSSRDRACLDNWNCVVWIVCVGLVLVVAET